MPITGLFKELNETDNFVDDLLLNDSENNFDIIRDKNGNILGLDTDFDSNIDITVGLDTNNDSIVDNYLYSILERPDGSKYIDLFDESVKKIKIEKYVIYGNNIFLMTDVGVVVGKINFFESTDSENFKYNDAMFYPNDAINGYKYIISSALLTEILGKISTSYNTVMSLTNGVTLELEGETAENHLTYIINKFNKLLYFSGNDREQAYDFLNGFKLTEHTYIIEEGASIKCTVPPGKQFENAIIRALAGSLLFTVDSENCSEADKNLIDSLLDGNSLSIDNGITLARELSPEIRNQFNLEDTDCIIISKTGTIISISAFVLGNFFISSLEELSNPPLTLIQETAGVRSNDVEIKVGNKTTDISLQTNDGVSYVSYSIDGELVAMTQLDDDGNHTGVFYLAESATFVVEGEEYSYDPKTLPPPEEGPDYEDLYVIFDSKVITENTEGGSEVLETTFIANGKHSNNKTKIQKFKSSEQ